MFMPNMDDIKLATKIKEFCKTHDIKVVGRTIYTKKK